jgi:hypothetical protein
MTRIIQFATAWRDNQLGVSFALEDPPGGWRTTRRAPLHPGRGARDQWTRVPRRAAMNFMRNHDAKHMGIVAIRSMKRAMAAGEWR